MRQFVFLVTVNLMASIIFPSIVLAENEDHQIVDRKIAEQDSKEAAKSKKAGEVQRSSPAIVSDSLSQVGSVMSSRTDSCIKQGFQTWGGIEYGEHYSKWYQEWRKKNPDKKLTPRDLPKFMRVGTSDSGNPVWDVRCDSKI